ncbi:MAG: tRNA pseudouridine(38-40) synthase TruA [Bacteroidota bacterium]
MRYIIELTYKGTHFHGWQKQPNVITVQEEIEQKLSLISGTETEIVGCGRTDTGVHARKYFAHFDNENELDCETLCMKLNKILSHDIAIRKVEKVENNFHARFDAKLRVYEYWILQKPDPFLQEFAWFVSAKLNMDAMNEASSLLLTHKDFECFSKVHTDVKTFICDVSFAKWELQNDKLVFTIKSDRFLRNMVRAIVGTLIEIGKGRMSLEDFKKILESKNRSEAGQSVPAHGLFLTEVHY